MDRGRSAVHGLGGERYDHQVLMAVQVVPGEETVLPLEMEFIHPQDGVEKQDCELRAAERWLEKHGEFYAHRRVTLLGVEPNPSMTSGQALGTASIISPTSYWP